MVAEGAVGVLPALSKAENFQGNINRFGFFWLQCCQDKVLFQLQMGTRQWSMTSLCAPKASGHLVLPELLHTHAGVCVCHLTSGLTPRSLELQSCVGSTWAQVAELSAAAAPPRQCRGN